MQDRIQLFLELVACNQPLFYWRYDPMGNLLESTCQAEKMLDEVFRLSGALEYVVGAETEQPMILGSNSFLLWVAGREMEGENASPCIFSALSLPTRFMRIPLTV